MGVTPLGYVFGITYIKGRERYDEITFVLADKEHLSNK